MTCAHDSTGSICLTSLLLADDDDLREVVEEFVAGLSDRIHEIRRALGESDWDRTAMLAHRLKGAAGSYGYPDISRLCAEMEHNARGERLGELERQVQELSDLAGAARRGLGSTP